MQPVEAARQAGPRLGFAVATGQRPGQRALGALQRRRGIGMQPRPRLAREPARAVVDRPGGALFGVGLDAQPTSPATLARIARAPLALRASPPSAG